MTREEQGGSLFSACGLLAFPGSLCIWPCEGTCQLEPENSSIMTADDLRSDRYGPTLVVHLGAAYNSLSENSLVEVERNLLACADSLETKNLVVDLSKTEFFGSRFIESLFRAHNRMKRKGGKFALSGLQPYPAEVIRISKLDTVWPLFANAQEAVAALGGAEDQG
jgi:anti-sigma B factor antagonist